MSKTLRTSCRCFNGFSGVNCRQPICTELNNCSGHGVCMEAEFCKCYLGYNGTDCSNYSCEAVNHCSGHGTCIGYDVCQCNVSWSGAACNIPDCSAVNNCSGQGNCIGVNSCSCYPLFDGKDCSQKAAKNLHAPVFERSIYRVNIPENAPLGTHILRMRANDSDSGRNGHIFYSMNGDNGVENVFFVDGKSGIIYNLVKVDFETLREVSFNVTIIATDDGVPQKWTSTVVQITVTDKNDNCPDFVKSTPENLKIDPSSLSPGDVLTKISATDQDSGMNSDITYNISSNDAFTIDPTTGIISVKSFLTKSEYRLTVTAADSGAPPCATETNITVTVGKTSSSRPQTDASSTPFTPTTPKTSTPNQKPEKPSYISEFTNPATDPVTSTRFTSPTRLVSSPFAEEATKSSQKSKHFMVIGLSAFGGVLMIVIIALIIMKVVCRRKVNPTVACEQTEVNDEIHVNKAFEMSDMSAKT